MTTETATGGCLCGTVRFEADLPSLWCAHCHCSLCRRAHGAAFVTWVGIAASGFRITSGQGELVSYRSSKEASRDFCARCGANLFFQSERWPGEVHVTRASFDAEIDREPETNVFCSDRPPWAGALPLIKSKQETS